MGAIILFLQTFSQLSAASQLSVLHIRVVEGDGAVHKAAARSSRMLAVEITDETGKPADGVAVSFRLPEQGPGGTYGGATRMRTNIVVTGSDGRAGVRDFTAGALTGPFQIRVTAAKDGVRAGIIVDQFIAEAPKQFPKQAKKVETGGPSARQQTFAESRQSRRWILWLAVAGGAAAAGVLASASAPGQSAGPAASGTTGLPSLGTPNISIGRP